MHQSNLVYFILDFLRGSNIIAFLTALSVKDRPEYDFLQDIIPEKIKAADALAKKTSLTSA
jgi:hypothetical protein